MREWDFCLASRQTNSDRHECLRNRLFSVTPAPIIPPTQVSVMNAAVLHQFGEPPRCEQFPEPVAGENEVIVQVHTASIKPVDRQIASGSHYATPGQLPFVCGIDGVGHLSDGQRVFFAGCRPPYGAMAQQTVVPKAFTFPLPATLTDELAAAIPNPGVSAWLALTFRAKLAAGENVLILGATGVTGGLAVQIAKLLGAARVVAAGRNQQCLQSRVNSGRCDDPPRPS